MIENLILSAPVFWLVAAIVFGVIEALTMGLITIWFAGGSLVALVAAVLNFSIPVQIILFLVVSVVLLIATRKIFVEKLNTGKQMTNVGALIGKIGTVKTDINPLSVGTVNLSGQVWSAVCADNDKTVKAGAKVKVTAIEGVKLIVEPEEEMRG
ncbi:MAG: NfeD family protein [Eubacteriaceae bacterium]|nr:NfeD family protein [Eubacteriaceae bacterium]